MSSQFIPLLLMSASATLLLVGVVLWASNLRLRQREDDESWRDSPPKLLVVFRPIVNLFAFEVRGRISPARYKRLQQRLSAAGMNYAVLPEELVVLRYICMMIGLMLSAYIYFHYSPLKPELLALALALIPLGFFYPEIWIRDRIKTRKKFVERDFPFILDLLILSMQAGLSYSAALSGAVGRLPIGPVKEEFEKLLREIKAGRARREALLAMAERMDMEAINNFVATINQADETGSEVGHMLRSQADQRRSERFLKAEEKAGKAPVKLLIPLVLFLFPNIFILLGFILITKMDAGMLPPIIAELLFTRAF